MIDTMGTNIKWVGDDGDLLLLLLLPEEVLIEILVRLPIVSLLRFKSVSKYWCNLIQTSFFIHLHSTFNSSSSSKQQQQQQLGGSDTFILQASGVSGSKYESELFVYSCESSAAAAAGYKLDNLEPPQCHLPIVMAGSCNGLICLHDSNLNDFFLWNPATRQSRILPKPIIIKDDEDEDEDEDEEEEEGFGDYKVFSHLVGFGFDVKTNDYKVLLITYCKHMFGQQLENFCQIQVYSLSTDSWRLLFEGTNPFPGVPCQGGSVYHNGIYLNGCYFFVGCEFSFDSCSYENSLIISFDFAKEIFTTMQFPAEHDDVVRKMWYLSCLGDKLALFAIRDYKKYEDCDIWVLNEHGVGAACDGGLIRESWTKFHFFQIQRNGVSGEWILPRGILNNGEFALLETKASTYEGEKRKKKKMQLYNLVTKEAKTDFLVCSCVKTVEVYKPSLALIIGGNGAAAAAATDRVIGGAI